jgi:hypothetical protein
MPSGHGIHDNIFFARRAKRGVSLGLTVSVYPGLEASNLGLISACPPGMVYTTKFSFPGGQREG